MSARKRPAQTVTVEPDPPIARHYVLVLIVEAALLSLLYWLEKHFS